MPAGHHVESANGKGYERTTMSKGDYGFVGSVGEHYVLYRLIRKSFNAVLAAPNTDAVDIYVADKAGKPFAVQVKTKGDRDSWLLKKHERIQDPRLFYTFVDLGRTLDERCPDVFIVPSEVVARAAHVSHQAWLNTPTKSGKPKKDGDMRDIYYTYPPRFGEVEGFPAGWMEEYRESWKLLQ
jgi:hypothetical protein